MQRKDLIELHFIAHLDNLVSIQQKGILCNDAVQKLAHKSVAMPVIQEKREKVRIPGGLKLHEYANLYLHARNPMMYVRRALHEQLAILRVHSDVLDLPGAVLADGNASSAYTAFWPSPAGLARLNSGLVFAEEWTDPDMIQYWKKKRIRCAELLVPKCVPADLITGVFVSGVTAGEKVAKLGVGWPVNTNAHLFFR